MRVTHSYAPITGSSNAVGALDAFAKEFPRACLDSTTTARLRKLGAHRGWEAVDYILTTANTWKTVGLQRDGTPPLQKHSPRGSASA